MTTNEEIFNKISDVKDEIDKVKMTMGEMLVSINPVECQLCGEIIEPYATESHDQFLDIHYVIMHSMKEIADEVHKNWYIFWFALSDLGQDEIIMS